jgi:3-hydroxybutyryl-CoA dehydrogenase
MAGKLGVKSGEGFYDYSESKKAEKVSKQFSK